MITEDRWSSGDRGGIITSLPDITKVTCHTSSSEILSSTPPTPPPTPSGNINVGRGDV